jgi:hypothetical protein
MTNRSQTIQILLRNRSNGNISVLVCTLEVSSQPGKQNLACDATDARKKPLSSTAYAVAHIVRNSAVTQAESLLLQSLGSRCKHGMRIYQFPDTSWCQAWALFLVMMIHLSDCSI